MKIFGNEVPEKVAAKAARNKTKLARKFKHDDTASYPLTVENNALLHDALGIKNIKIGKGGEKVDKKNGIILGTIRMGFGHYRIAMALASAAKSKGLTPYWFDLMSFEQTAGARIIKHLESLYSLGSKLSQKIEVFNKFYWEPLNAEGFKKLSFNASDLRMTELMTDIYKNLPKDVPYVASHAWPAQSAVAAGMKTVVNVIPDNWPMALHLAEGSIHCVQSDSAYLGYRLLREMGEKGETLKPMPASSIAMTGHFVDHELVANLDADCAKRLARIDNNKERRLLLTIGGAGAQLELLAEIINKLMPRIRQGKVTIFLNIGDHKALWDRFLKASPDLKEMAQTHFNDMADVNRFVTEAQESDVKGIHAFYHPDVFGAVYTTNLLMRCSDVLVTKPSELAYYPIPKLFIKRVGGHEMWGAIRGAEIGDSTIECNTDELLYPTLDMLIDEPELLKSYCHNIIKLNQIGAYNGAYKVIDIALGQAR